MKELPRRLNGDKVKGSMPTQFQSASTDFAGIEAIDATHSGKILDATSMKVIRRLITIGPLVLLTGVAGVIFGGMPAPEQTAPVDKLHAGFLFGGILLLLLCVPLTMHRLQNRWLRHIARRQINRRPNKLVDPYDPRARFVEIIPKSNWEVKQMPENAIDVGFLSIDPKNRTVLFEGENERYKIPAKVIIKCEADSYSRSTVVDKYGARYSIRFYFVVLTIKTSEQSTVELPFRIRISNGRFSDKNQQKGNFEFYQDIHHLISA
jgi:hypothetical protein